MTLLTTEISDTIAELQRLSDLFALRREQLARSVGLSVQQWRVLEEISEEHFMPSMFARTRDSSAAAVSKIIRQLIDKGLIDVAVDGTDGRVRRYSLTKGGRGVMASLRESREEAIDTIWAGIPPEDLMTFSRISGRLSELMEAYASRQQDLN